MSIKVKQLPDDPPSFVVLLCPTQHEEWSANRGDYWAVDSEFELRCSCGEEMLIAEKRTTYDLVAGEKQLAN